MDNSQQKMPIKISQDISECNNAWLIYLQGLAGLCSAGARVSHSLQVLAHGMPIGATAGQCRSAWDELLRATQAATLTVRSEVASGLRDLASLDDQNSRSSEHFISTSVASLINLQYQFCVACCECLGQIAAPDGCNQHHQQQPPQQQQQQQQISPSSAEAASYRQQQLFCRLLGGQRRWSEVATRRTAERDEECDEGAPRRWSVPWEGPGAGGVPVSQHQLTVPLAAHERSSRSTTPDSASLASVTLTNCSQTDNREPWPPVPLFPRDNNAAGMAISSYFVMLVFEWLGSIGGWYQTTLDGSMHSEGMAGSTQARRGGSPRPAYLNRTRTGWTPHEPLYTTIWGEQEGEHVGSNLELFAPSQPESNNQSYQRKSSSSTDSSSSSLPQHATNATTPEQQRPSHLYSMWSGSEMAPALPFIHLPLSPNQSQQPDNPSTLLP
ncbi:hypothetical protein B566_EDAN004037 [Ephemera danica]|nr:hypothetical protein B566_EDAN004037 [Ephemera danica]